MRTEGLDPCISETCARLKPEHHQNTKRNINTYSQEKREDTQQSTKTVTKTVFTSGYKIYCTILNTNLVVIIKDNEDYKNVIHRHIFHIPIKNFICI